MSKASVHFIPPPPAVVLLALVAAWSAPTVAGAGDSGPHVSRGAVLYADCARCHGEQGEGLEATQAPRLARREDWYLKKQLEQFRRRERGRDDSKETGFLSPESRTQVMHAVVDKLSRSDTRALLAHLAKLQPGPVPAARQGEASRGRAHYAACVECHGAKAGGSWRRSAPQLTGQHDWYLFQQLRDFRMGWRGTASKDPHVKLMRGQLDLDDAALHDLVAYIVSLNAPPSAASPGTPR